MTISKIRRTDAGLTLVEALAALVIFMTVLGFMIPLFANQRLDTINNEIKTGAVALSQEILDQVRQAPINTLPPIPPSLSATTTDLPLLLGQTTATSVGTITKMGKSYNATIFYCPDTPTDIYCNSNARHIKVQVSYNDKIIYTVETVYTQLQ